MSRFLCWIILKFDEICKLVLGFLSSLEKANNVASYLSQNLLLIREYFRKMFRFEEALVGFFFVRLHQTFCKYKFYTSKTIKFCEHINLELNLSVYNNHLSH